MNETNNLTETVNMENSTHAGNPSEVILQLFYELFARILGLNCRLIEIVTNTFFKRKYFMRSSARLLKKLIKLNTGFLRAEEVNKFIHIENSNFHTSL